MYFILKNMSVKVGMVERSFSLDLPTTSTLIFSRIKINKIKNKNSLLNILAFKVDTKTLNKMKGLII